MSISRILLQILSVLLGLMLILLIFWFTQYRQINLKSNPAALHRGENGAIHIRNGGDGTLVISAESQADLAMAQGFAAASEHLWQMELLLRAARGRLSEILGQETLALDRHFRNLQIDSLSVRLAAGMEPETYQWLAAYVKGVNAFVDSSKTQLPVAYQLNDCRPLAWSVPDVIAIQRMIAWLHNRELQKPYLSGFLEKRDFDRNIRWQVLGKNTLGKTALEVLESFLLSDLTFRRWWGDLREPDGGFLAWPAPNAPDSLKGPWEGLTASQPLGGKMPLPWQRLRLELPQGDMTGLGIPGMPGLWCGSNAERSWSFLLLSEGGVTLSEVDARFNELVVGRKGKRMNFRKPNIFVRKQKVPHSVFTLADTLVLAPEEALSGKSTALTLHWAGWEPSDEFDLLHALMTGKRLSLAQQRRAAFIPGWRLVVVAENGSSLSLGIPEPPLVEEEASSPQKAMVYEDPPRVFLLSNAAFLGANAVGKNAAKRRDDFLTYIESPLPLTVDPWEYWCRGLIDEWIAELARVEVELPESDRARILWVLENWSRPELSGEIAPVLLQYWQYAMYAALFDEENNAGVGNRILDDAVDLHLGLFYEMMSSRRADYFRIPGLESNRRARFLAATLQEAVKRLGEVSDLGVYAWRWSELFPGREVAFTFRMTLFDRDSEGEKRDRIRYVWARPERRITLKMMQREAVISGIGNGP